MTDSKRIRAAIYVRMSTTMQEDSPVQQRNAVMKYAKDNGYSVVAEYQDLAITGDSVSERPQFQAMLEAAKGGDFEAILCFDQDRFGRFDMIDCGEQIAPLRRAGVHLATCAQGLIDWNDFASKLVFTIQQEQKHLYLRDLSKNISRGMEAGAKTGEWVTGRVPFGYSRGEDNRLHLGSPADVAVVQYVFEQYATGQSARALAEDMGAKGWMSPQGTLWTRNGLIWMLKNEAYVGHVVWNRFTYSKYKGDGPRAKTLRRENDRDKWIIVENSHPAIITPALFDKVASRLQANQRGKNPMPVRGGGEFVLTGMLVCGECGRKMMGNTKPNGIEFSCYSYRQRGSCERNMVKQDDVLAEIADVLEDQYFNPAYMREIRGEVVKQLKDGKRRPSVKVARGHLQTVDRKLGHARSRLIEVSSDMVSVVEDRIRELEAEKLTLEMSIAAAEQSPDVLVKDLDSRIDKAMKCFETLRQAITEGDAQAARGYLQEMVAKVELWFTRVPYRKGKWRYSIKRGRIYLSDNLASSHLPLLPR